MYKSLNVQIQLSDGPKQHPLCLDVEIQGQDRDDYYISSIYLEDSKVELLPLFDLAGINGKLLLDLVYDETDVALEECRYDLD